jgi:hypothetical protein
MRFEIACSQWKKVRFREGKEMIRDPFYRHIIARLDGDLDTDAFEQCSQDLLRTIYPTLVPIRGGNDSGMDGVTANLDGPPIVLVSTTGERVKRNLEESLDSMVSRGIPFRKIISATSRKLTPEEQKELRKTAKDRKFKLVQIYERAGMANLLYQSPKWCRELLDLTGDPPPLSIIPRSLRPMITDQLIGHTEAARRLIDIEQDRLLVGQPGSGKTFLLSTLAKEHGWLFVVTPEVGRIAEGIRSQDPRALIVDDAQINPEFISELVRFRRESGFTLPIVAACWPGAKDQVSETLALTRERVCELERLTRPEIVQVLEMAGLTGPDTLIYQILNQAGGRPGLAITLANLCLEGDESDIKDVVLGDALLRSIRTLFERLIGPHAIDVVASLAVGGRSGMQLDAVAEFLSKSPAEVRHAAAGLAAGGVIYDVDGIRLSVRPPELRHALIREYFFKGAVSLNISPLLQLSTNIADSAETLVDSRNFGAAIPNELLRSLLERANSEKAWIAYASGGEDEARWVLSHHPELVLALTGPALHYAPELELPFLLSKAVGDTRALHSHPDHGLRLIEDWIQSGYPGTGEPIRRRKALLSVAQAWLRDRKDMHVGIQALSLVLTPKFESSNLDPVLGDTVTLRWGLLAADEIEEISSLWKSITETLRSIQISEWSPLINAVSDWVYPQRHIQRAIADEAYERMRSLAAEMVKDLIEVAKPSVGVMHRLSELAEDLDVEITCPVDKEFEAIFPSIPENMEGYAEQASAIKQLAVAWASEQPRKIVERIEHLESEAKKISETNRQTPFLADELAKLVKSPIDWVNEIRAVPSIGDLAAPFLLAAAAAKQPGWEDAFIWFISNESTRFSTVPIALAMESPTEKILDLALRSLSGMSTHVEVLCLRKQLSDAVVRRLLVHPDDLIASNAAIGVWTADDKREIPAVLRDTWRQAVLRGSRKEYWIGEILKIDSAMACEYLLKQIQAGERLWSTHDHATREALKAIAADQRSEILKVLHTDLWSHDLIALLIGDDVELYRELLSVPALKRHHLDPLAGRPNEGNWTERAIVALEAGITADEVAYAPLGSSYSWVGKESDMLSEWLAAFQAIQRHEDERIRHVAEEGIRDLTKRRDAVLKREREEETEGRH